MDESSRRSGSVHLQEPYDVEGVFSPRMAAAVLRIDERGAEALQEFWDELASASTPVIEPAPDAENWYLVTFVWRGSHNEKAVALFGYFTNPRDFHENRLTQIRGTDIWFRTLLLPWGGRFCYAFIPDDPGTPMASDVEGFNKRLRTFQPDPLNSSRLTWQGDTELGRVHLDLSVLELPGALPQPQASNKPEVPKGSLNEHRLESRLLDNGRKVWVYTPVGYEAGSSRYPLAVFFDGYDFHQRIPLPTILDNLISEKKIPPIVCALIDSVDDATRMKEYHYHPPLTEFVRDELLPWVRSEYRIKRDPSEALIGGLSAGARAAAFVALTLPEEIESVLCLSGAFASGDAIDNEIEWLAHEFAVRDVKKLKFYLTAGWYEPLQSGPLGANILIANRHMRDVLLAKGHEVVYSEYVGGHDYVCWRGKVAEGLISLFAH